MSCYYYFLPIYTVITFIDLGIVCIYMYLCNNFFVSTCSIHNCVALNYQYLPKCWKKTGSVLWIVIELHLIPAVHLPGTEEQ